MGRLPASQVGEAGGPPDRGFRERESLVETRGATTPAPPHRASDPVVGHVMAGGEKLSEAGRFIS